MQEKLVPEIKLEEARSEFSNTLDSAIDRFDLAGEEIKEYYDMTDVIFDARACRITSEQIEGNVDIFTNIEVPPELLPYAWTTEPGETKFERGIARITEPKLTSPILKIISISEEVGSSVDFGITEDGKVFQRFIFQEESRPWQTRWAPEFLEERQTSGKVREASAEDLRRVTDLLTTLEASGEKRTLHG